MSGELLAAINGLKALVGLANTVADTKIASAITSAIINIQSDLMGAQAVALDSQREQATLAKRVAELEQEIVKFKNWEAESEDYSLKQVGNTGNFVYIYAPLVQTTKPRHLACANCYQNRKIRILQVQRRAQGIFPGYVCQECRASILTSGGFPPPVDQIYDGIPTA
jgi:hypothetical protein